MELLKRLTPAETLLLLENSNASLKDLMKFTLMDLFIKRVLIMKKVKKQAHKRDRVRVHNCIIIDENFATYKPLAHELIYLSAYQKSPSLKIIFRHLVIMGLQNSGGRRTYVNDFLVVSPELSKYFHRGILLLLFGKPRLNTEGKKAQLQLRQSIEQLEQKLPFLITSDKTKALEIIESIKGNIFLLKNLDFELLKEVDSEMTRELQRQLDNNEGGYGGCGGWTGWGWDVFDSFGDSFDSSYDSVSDAGSGCGGDSGCSGCGGCGGCGGCS